MKKNTLFGSVAAMAAGAGLSALVMSAPAAAHLPQGGSIALAPMAGQAGRLGNVSNLADLVERVSPSVVQITVRSRAPERATSGAGANPFEGTPFGEFFRNLPRDGAPQQDMPSPMGSGSGFFIDGGYIVTNHHVVENSRRLTVRFEDGRELDATLVGSDEKTDLAVLKLVSSSAPAALGWGDSNRVRPGESVFAVGSPFGLGNSVTAGIVSARGRRIGGTYDDFIQVDAPINRGNSGGPLFNEAGQVIGVNSAIFSPTGGNVGIGFAIPSDLAQSIVKQIIATGGVERGWLGVEIQGVTPDMARSLGLDAPKGAIVARVNEGSPAAKAGVKTGDLILSFGSISIGAVNDLTRAVADTKAGTSRDLRIIRDGRQQTLKVTIAALEPAETQPSAVASNSRATPGAAATVSVPGIGLELTSDGASGVMVARVTPNSSAADALVQTGDRVVKVNQVEVSSPEGARKEVENARTARREAVLLQLERNGRTLFLGVPLGGD